MFEAMLSERFREGQDQGKPIVLQECSTPIVEAWFSFIYGIDWEPRDEIGFALALLEFGHRFNIAALESHARARAQDLADASTSYNVLSLAKATGREATVMKMIEFKTDNLDDTHLEPWFERLAMEEMQGIRAIVESFTARIMKKRGVRHMKLASRASAKETACRQEIVFNAIAVWVSADIDEPTKYMEDLLDFVKLSSGVPIKVIVQRMERTCPLNSAPNLLLEIARVFELQVDEKTVLMHDWTQALETETKEQDTLNWRIAEQEGMNRDSIQRLEARSFCPNCRYNLNTGSRCEPRRTWFELALQISLLYGNSKGSNLYPSAKAESRVKF
jgi:hypothetical protein